MVEPQECIPSPKDPTLAFLSPRVHYPATLRRSCCGDQETQPFFHTNLDISHGAAQIQLELETVLGVPLAVLFSGATLRAC